MTRRRMTASGRARDDRNAVHGIADPLCAPVWDTALLEADLDVHPRYRPPRRWR